ncbi:MAG: helix-turn-helix domain-containing protein, partial [Ignavibacteria bacterium]|nr:helix-turn-helix domain-containing protein [Ignavibacteria bacterium]
DNIHFYESHIHPLNTEIDFPFIAGKLQELIPKEHQYGNKSHLEIIEQSLFNESNLAKIVPEVGPKGIYYLELRPGHKLKQLVVEPNEVVIDIYIGPKDTLIYSFYNPTRRNSISITAAIEKDTEGVYSQIKAEPNDLIWRHYFVQRALLSSQKNVSIVKQSEKFDKEILTADEAANYSRMQKKTLQNYASKRKIKSLKGGKFRRKDLDEFLEQKKKK